MYRYAEGTGARFNEITDLDFLSSTELICTDRHNHCLRLVDLSLSPPTVSTFAGSCTVPGIADGHRLSLALFRYPAYAEVNNNNSIMFVFDDYKKVRKIDLKMDIVSTLVTLKFPTAHMKLVCDSLLYFAQGTRVTIFSLRTKEESVVAGGDSRGVAIGSFEDTRFEYACGLWLWRDKEKTLLLAADYSSNRFVG